MAPTRPSRGDLNRVFLPSDPRLEWPGEGPLFELHLNECQEAKMWALFESPPGPLFLSDLGSSSRYGTSVNHCHMYLNMFIKFVENNEPINQQEGRSICVCSKDDQRYSIVCNIKSVSFFA